MLYKDGLCDCPDCRAVDNITLGDQPSGKFVKIPPDLLGAWHEKVWRGSVDQSDIDKGLFGHIFNAYKSKAEYGYGKLFSEADNIAELEMFQKMQRQLSSFTGYKLSTYTDELMRLKDKYKDKDSWLKAVQNTDKKYLTTWRKTEERTISVMAQSANNWQEIQRTAYLYPNIKYVTAHDERVRDSHAAMDGVIYPINHVFWKTHWPPNGWNCRCKALASDRQLRPAAADIKIDPVFQNNVGESGEFFPNHPYYPRSKDDTGNISYNPVDGSKVMNQAMKYWQELSKTNLKESVMSKYADTTFNPAGGTEFGISGRKITNIKSLSHDNAAERNELLHNLELLIPKMKPIAIQLPKRFKQNVLHYELYKLTVADIDYLVMVEVYTNGDAAKIFAITNYNEKAP